MKINRISIFIVSAILLLGMWLIDNKRAAKSLHKSPDSTPAEESTQASNQIREPSSNSVTSAANSPVEKDKSAIASLEDMTRTMAQFTKPESRLTDLVQYLESTRQQPLVTKDSNPDTGDMVVVRTRSPLPGTRYFHAQYFGDENQKSFVQHMSFEFKPGPLAMDEAVYAVQKSFPDLPAPKIQKPDFVQWDIPGGYILWVKKMDSKDLQDNPFNAYSENDVGTVRVAMELEIHGDDDHQ